MNRAFYCLAGFVVFGLIGIAASIIVKVEYTSSPRIQTEAICALIASIAITFVFLMILYCRFSSCTPAPQTALITQSSRLSGLTG